MKAYCEYEGFDPDSMMKAGTEEEGWRMPPKLICTFDAPP